MSDDVIDVRVTLDAPLFRAKCLVCQAHRHFASVGEGDLLAEWISAHRHTRFARSRAR